MELVYQNIRNQGFFDEFICEEIKKILINNVGNIVTKKDITPQILQKINKKLFKKGPKMQKKNIIDLFKQFNIEYNQGAYNIEQKYTFNYNIK